MCFLCSYVYLIRGQLCCLLIPFYPLFFLNNLPPSLIYNITSPYHLNIPLYIYRWICVCVCGCMCVYIFICVYMSVYISRWMWICICVSMEICVCICISMCVFICVSVCVHLMLAPVRWSPLEVRGAGDESMHL